MGNLASIRIFVTFCIHIFSIHIYIMQIMYLIWQNKSIDRLTPFCTCSLYNVKHHSSIVAWKVHVLLFTNFLNNTFENLLQDCLDLKQTIHYSTRTVLFAMQGRKYPLLDKCALLQYNYITKYNSPLLSLRGLSVRSITSPSVLLHINFLFFSLLALSVVL